jgi:hypothetical protein
MTDTTSTPQIKSKRGRKPKVVTNDNLANEEVIPNTIDEPITILITEQPSENIDHTTELNDKPLPKKRGRKPKGGKIIQPVVPSVKVEAEKENVILHLKCCLKDLNIQQNEEMEAYNFSSEIVYEPIHNDMSHIYVNNSITHGEHLCGGNEIEHVCNNNNDKEVETKEIWKKLKQLEHNLHLNNIDNKKSACFWCTHDFDNPPIYIPKYYLNESYHVYGCFCSPECSVAYLMEENIDSSTKFERYHLLNHIYTKIYDYNKNIKPAPNPYYMLEKFYGNLSIQEYRTLLSNERLFLIVDKPLTRIMPELHQDNEDYIINHKIIPTNNQGIKKKLQRKTPVKTNIFNENFGQPVV